MTNCIFSAYCMEYNCDKSCPKYAESSYLLERNDISEKSNVMSCSFQNIQMADNLLSKCQGRLGCIITNKTVATAELFTYVAICNNWKGSQLHCNVYNLKYSNFLEEIKRSWSLKSEPEALEYKRIWSESAKVLMISHLDYVSFGDFESQTLLNLIQSRDKPNLTTIVVSQDINQLVGKSNSMFFLKLQSLLGKAVKL